MHALAIAGIIIAFAGHFPLYFELYQKRIRLNLATWTLWVIADFLSIITALNAGSGIPLLAITYMTGSLVAVVLIVRSGYFQWGRLETFTSCMSLLCLGLWLISGPLIALAAITLGKYGAGLPSLADTLRHPERKQAVAWLSFSCGALLTILSQGSWTAANSFYPTVGMLFNGTMGLAHLRKRAEARV